MKRSWRDDCRKPIAAAIEHRLQSFSPGVDLIRIFGRQRTFDSLLNASMAIKGSIAITRRRRPITPKMTYLSQYPNAEDLLPSGSRRARLPMRASDPRGRTAFTAGSYCPSTVGGPASSSTTTEAAASGARAGSETVAPSSFVVAVSGFSFSASR